jgi:pterin-4a-carbinolamine dehydratase
MRLAELLMENNKKEKTGFAPVDDMLGKMFEISPADERLPVKPLESKWIQLSSPQRLVRTFIFDSFGKMKYFINELIEYQERHHHHSTIIITGYDVTVETFTHEAERVTEQDTNLAKFCDEIFQDTRFISND